MTKDDEDERKPHARRTDPDTSHEAVPSPRVMHRQSIQLLREAYGPADRPLLDHEAYDRSVYKNLPKMRGKGHQRCSDLRAAGFIAVVDRARMPSGKSGRRCVITAAGRAFLARLDNVA